MKRISLSFLLVLSACGLFAQVEKNPESTELWEPVPPVVKPGEGTAAPSDAIVLFDGTNLSEWTNDKGEAAGWTLADGCVTVKAGTGIIKTKRRFGDCQLHIEWRSPAEVKGESQGRGNSGIFLQNLYEVQVLDCYNNITYSNGQTGSIYKQSIPLMNACKKPGEWQAYEYIGSPTLVVHGMKEPLSLQDHGNPVSYRNIWIREL